MQKIGMLLPRSTYYPTIGRDMMEGLRSGLEHAGFEDIKIVSENIGFGAEKRECFAAAERLLLNEDIKIVFAYLSHRMAQLLRPLFVSMNRILVVLDAGSNMPQEWPVSSNVIFLSLHNALGYWLTAKMAERDGYTQMGAVTGFYDGGYLQTFALAKSYFKQGGNIVYNHATGYQQQDFTIAPIKHHIAQFPEACIVALFSGDYAEWFFAGLKEHAPENVPNVYASGFALEESVVDKIDIGNAKVKGFVPWLSTIDSSANSAFVQAMDDKEMKANIFSLLGWEASLISIPLLELMKEQKNNGRNVIEQFKGMTFEGPRGEISFHDTTHYSISPMYEVELVVNEQGKPEMSVLDVLEKPHDVFEELSSESLEEAVSGWHNSYTCI